MKLLMMTSSITLSLNSTLGHRDFPLVSEEERESALVIGSSAASSRSLPIFAPSRIAGSKPETAISPHVDAANEAAMMLLRIDWTAYVCVAESRGAAATASSQRERATRAAAGTRKVARRKSGGMKKMKRW